MDSKYHNMAIQYFNHSGKKVVFVTGAMVPSMSIKIGSFKATVDFGRLLCIHPDP